jgi:glycerophosphoryl diester phosphodiesterase
MLKSFCLLILSITILNPVIGQEKYTAANIHSHNDYSRPDAFYHAFNAGAGAIEADVFLREGKLMVAHDSSSMKQTSTLKAMYLQPILKEMQTGPRPLNLVIDLKEAYTPILAELLRELESLKPFIRSGNSNSPLTIIITGNRPPPAEYKNYPSYIYFDDDLQLPHNPNEWKRVAQVSLNFTNYSKWNGDMAIPPVDEKVLRSVINAVHQSGKKIRFWAAPDNPAGWQKLMELKADILSTDEIDKLLIEIRNSK